LYDAVRPSDRPGEDHFEVVKATVRKYFQTADPEDKGHVDEERFRAFCRFYSLTDKFIFELSHFRRTGLHDALSTSELRILTERLRKPNASGIGTTSRINYEKYSMKQCF
jgi:hypothetical protein